MFVSADDCTWQRKVRQTPSALKFVASEVRSILPEVAYPFIMHIGGPIGAEWTRQCEVHKEVPQPGGIKNVCVVEGPGCRHESDPEFLVIRSQFVEHGQPFRVNLFLVGNERFKPHPAMRANLSIFDLPVV